MHKNNIGEYPTLSIRKGKENAIRRRHPWIFSGAIFKKPKHLKDGSVVRVVDHQDNFLATGHYHDGSIMIRILSFDDVEINQNFWNNKIATARDYRKQLGLIDNNTTNAYRLIHGEGDGISGLIIDIYDDCAVIQCHSIGCYRSITEISKAIESNYGEAIKTIYCKSKNSLPKDFSDYNEDYFIKGNQEEKDILENGVKFKINWVEGQKTGFFLDQRENRKILGAMSERNTVLNCFCYTGGFSMYALGNEASHVKSIDISQSAMDMVAKNHTLNAYGDNHTMEAANVMEYLSESKDQYDIVIIDPPAFAKNVNKRHNAVQAYKRLNKMALKRVKKGGLLFTFSCSQVVGPELFYNTIRAAAIEVGKNIRIVRHLSQAPDHPINIYHPEGNYLKGLVLFIE